MAGVLDLQHVHHALGAPRIEFFPRVKGGIAERIGRRLVLLQHHNIVFGIVALHEVLVGQHWVGWHGFLISFDDFFDDQGRFVFVVQIDRAVRRLPSHLVWVVAIKLGPAQPAEGVRRSFDDPHMRWHRAHQLHDLDYCV
jgi:hypothetical protein